MSRAPSPSSNILPTTSGSANRCSLPTSINPDDGRRLFATRSSESANGSVSSDGRVGLHLGCRAPGPLGRAEQDDGRLIGVDGPPPKSPENSGVVGGVFLAVGED